MSEQVLTVAEQLPGLNDILRLANKRRGKWNAYADLKNGIESGLVWEIRRQKLVPVTKPVHLWFHWLEKTRRRDLDNIAAAKKFVIDALVQAEILPADGWRWIVGFTDTFCVASASSVIVRVEEREVTPWQRARRTKKGKEAVA